MKLKTILSVLPVITALLLLTSNAATAQVIVQEGIKPMSKGEKNCFYIELTTTDSKLVTEVWKDFMKDYKGKTKTDRKTKEMFTDDAVIKEMSENTVDVYARIDQQMLTVWFDLGGAYLSSYQHPGQYPAVEKMLNMYDLNLSKVLAKNDLGRKEEELKSLEKEFKKLEDDNKKFYDSIEKAKEAIAKAESDIAQNNQMQGAKKKDIENKAEEVNAAKEHLNSLGKKGNR